jgi:hypothetical protein
MWKHCLGQLWGSTTKLIEQSFSLKAMKLLLLMFWCCGILCWHRPPVWPPWSTDLSLANLWRHPKSILYTQNCNTWDEPWNVFEPAGATMCTMPDVFQWTRNSWQTGIPLCFDYVMVDHFNISCKLLVTGQVPFISCLINCLSTTTLSFSSSWFLLQHLANKVVVAVHLYKCFYMPLGCRTWGIYLRYVIKTHLFMWIILFACDSV